MSVWVVKVDEEQSIVVAAGFPVSFCFPAFRGHVTVFSCLLIRFSECLQLGHSLEVTTKIDRFRRIDDCIVWNIVFVLSRFKIVAVLAVLEIKVRKQE